MYVTIFEIYHLKLFYIMQYIIWNKIDSNNLPVYNTASWYDSITYNVYHYRVCMCDTISYHIIWCNTILHNMKYLFVSYDIISFCTVLNDTISHYMIQYCIVWYNIVSYSLISYDTISSCIDDTILYSMYCTISCHFIWYDCSYPIIPYINITISYDTLLYHMILYYIISLIKVYIVLYNIISFHHMRQYRIIKYHIWWLLNQNMIWHNMNINFN